jgi:hypothetical protein
MFKHKEAPQVESVDEQFEIKRIVSELEGLLADPWLKKSKTKKIDSIVYPRERDSWFTRALLVLEESTNFLLPENIDVARNEIRELIESIKSKHETDEVYCRKIQKLIKLALIELKD